MFVVVDAFAKVADENTHAALWRATSQVHHVWRVADLNESLAWKHIESGDVVVVRM